MRQLLLIIVLAIIVLAGVGVLMLGVFPPHAAPQPVAHTIPNDRFQAH
jgi:hypothetical protein